MRIWLRYSILLIALISSICCIFKFVPNHWDYTDNQQGSESNVELRQASIGVTHDISRLNRLASSSELVDLPQISIKFDSKQFIHMNTVDIIYYGFNLTMPGMQIPQNLKSDSLDSHKQESLTAGEIRSNIDHYVHSEGERLFAFNMLASNRIGLIRSLPDTRNFMCKQNNDKNTLSTIYDDTIVEEQNSFPKNFNSTLLRPKASIVICYYNEAPSALLRTIYSILRRSPKNLLHEVIVVDDFSNEEFHMDKMRAFVPMQDIVSFHRTNKREGLIRARLVGAKLASSDILIFLDSHVEPNEGWLEPLINQISADRRTIACPMIDLINPETLVYTSSPMVVGGMTWALHFKWINVPSEKLKTYEDFVKPLDSPTMAGGLYAIDREYFKYIGEYDDGMELWGGENVEMSIRTWLCGGKIVVLSCSRVGHIFRKRRPYDPEPDKPDCLLYNSHRAARVWLDDYINYFYDEAPGARNLDSGDISDRIALKNRLKCHGFDHYVHKVFPQLFSDITKVKESKQSIGRPKLFKSKSRVSNRVTR